MSMDDVQPSKGIQEAHLDQDDNEEVHKEPEPPSKEELRNATRLEKMNKSLQNWFFELVRVELFLILNMPSLKISKPQSPESCTNGRGFNPTEACLVNELDELFNLRTEFQNKFQDFKSLSNDFLNSCKK